MIKKKLNKISSSSVEDEREFMESMLNMKCSGVDPIISLCFFALEHSWHHDKVIYYLELLNKQEDKK